MVGAPALGALLGGAYGAGSGGLEGAIRGAGQGAVRVGGIGLGAGLGGVLSALLNEKIPQVTQLRLPIWGAGLGHALTSALFSDSNKTRSLAQKHRLAKLMANEEKYENEKVKTENEKKANLYDLAGKGTADESSLRAAIFTATDIFLKRKEYRAFAANPLQKQDIKENREDRRE